jgi:hypothetical protein
LVFNVWKIDYKKTGKGGLQKKHRLDIEGNAKILQKIWGSGVVQYEKGWKDIKIKNPVKGY